MRVEDGNAVVETIPSHEFAVNCLRPVVEEVLLAVRVAGVMRRQGACPGAYRIDDPSLWCLHELDPAEARAVHLCAGAEGKL